MAACAAEALRTSSWSARHPYLFSLALGCCALAFNVVLIIGIAAAAGHRQDARPDGRAQWLAAEVAVGALNWLTPLAGGGFLLWIGRRIPVGWKTLISASVGLALAVSTIGVWYIPHFTPGYGPADHRITLVLMNSPLACLVLLCAGEFDDFRRSLLDYGTYQTFLCLGRLLLPVTAVFGFRYVIVARTANPRSSVPPGAIS